MATGIKMPVKASRAGGTEYQRDSKQKEKVFRLALSVGDDKNPFQDVGLKEDAIYQVEDALAASEIRLEVERILQKFTGSIAIKPGSEITVFRKDDEGIYVQFEWIDLETNETGEFLQPFRKPGV
jgi:hypothetical protein